MRAKLLRLTVCWLTALSMFVADAPAMKGDGPAQVEALVATALRLPAAAPEADRLLAEALTIGQAESAHPLVAAEALHNAGWSCFHQGRLVRARDFFAAALDIREGFIPESLEVAASLNGLGFIIGYAVPPGSSGFREQNGLDGSNIVGYLGDLRTAVQYQRRALAIQEKLAPDSPDVAVSLTSLGSLAIWQGDVFINQRNSEAENYLKRALAIQERLMADSLDMAWSLLGLGYVAIGKEDFATAQDHMGRALAMQEKLAPNSLDVAESFLGLGVVAQWQGDMVTAQKYTLQALAIQQTLLPESLHLASSLKRLGYLTHYQGDLTAARDYNERSLRLRETLAPDSLYVADSLHATGNTAVEQGDLIAAKEYHGRALAIYEKLAPNSMGMTYNLHGMGRLAGAQGDLEKARMYHERALLIREKLAPDSFVLAASLSQLGRVAREQGDLEAAEGYYRRAFSIVEKRYPNPLFVAANLYGLALVAQDRGDIASAEDYFKQTLDVVNRVAPQSLGMAELLHRLAWIAHWRGDLSEAERLARQAWELVRRQAAGVIGDEARQAFNTSTAEYAATFVRAQLARGNAASAFITMEEGRSQALQQILAERQLEANTGDTKLLSDYQAAVAARNRAEHQAARTSVRESLTRRELEARRKRGADEEAIRKAQAALEAATREFQEAQVGYTLARIKTEQLWADIKKSTPRAHTPPLTVQQAQQALPPDTLFVAFSTGNEQTQVFLLRAGASIQNPISAYTVSVTLKELRALVERHRKEVSAPTRLTISVTASRALFVKLFPSREVRQAIEAAQRLLISPDGPLWDVSFAALVTNPVGAPHYLGSDRPITYTQSLTLFAQSRNDAPHIDRNHQLRALVVGDPIFNRATTEIAQVAANKRNSASRAGDSRPTRRAPRYYTGERGYLFVDGQPPEPLPETKREAVEIAKLYGTDPLTEEAATEAAVRSRLGQADLIHLATHGYIHWVRPMSSGVLLTVPEREPSSDDTANDGALLAWEIYSQLKLQAEIVVLSACETGRGQHVRNEGIIGLTRALQYAGVRSIVASQWKVPDKSTSELMVTFHRLLRQGATKDEALRQAMAVVRQHRATAHPHYWAGFFLIGDPANPNLRYEPSPIRE